MIKNWLVKTKQIKKKKSGFQAHVNYLINEKKPSHVGTTINVLNDASKAILEEIDNRTLYRQENGLRGGGVSNYATSFVVSLPTSIKQPNQDQWRQIGLYGIKKIAEEIGVEYKDLKKISHIVLHDEKDKHSHIHVLVGNVLDNKVIKGVSQFKATHAFKKSVNYSVKQLLNEDHNDYVPESTNKNLPAWLVKALKAEKIMKEFNDFKNSINNWVDGVLNKKNAFLLSQKAAKNFDKLEEEIPNKKNTLIDKLENAVEEIENDLVVVDENDNFEKPIPESQKVTPKTKRKRRRRTNTNKPQTA